MEHQSDIAGRLVCSDNLVFMQSLPEGCCDLIYVDPPFFTGRTQATQPGSPTFRDYWPDGIDGYLTFLRPRLAEMRRLLAASGTLYVHLDWRAVHYVKVLLDELMGYDNFLNEIVWSYRTGGNCRQWFARKHDTILAYARQAGTHTFHIQREGKFRTDGLNYDEDGRPYKNTKKGRLYFNSDGPAMTDVWELPFLSTVSNERNGYPTQKPEALLERIIQASSNPGDLVADFFCGSGTTLAVARRLGRNWAGCDIEPAAVELASTRLNTALQSTGPDSPSRVSAQPAREDLLFQGP